MSNRIEVSACLARGEDWSGKDSESDDEEGEEEEEEGGGGGNESGVSSPDVGPVTKKTKVSRGAKIDFDKNPIKDENGRKTQLLRCIIQNKLQFFNPLDRGAELGMCVELVEHLKNSRNGQVNQGFVEKVGFPF